MTETVTVGLLRAVPASTGEDASWLLFLLLRLDSEPDLDLLELLLPFIPPAALPFLFEPNCRGAGKWKPVRASASRSSAATLRLLDEDVVGDCGSCAR